MSSSERSADQSFVQLIEQIGTRFLLFGDPSALARVGDEIGNDQGNDQKDGQSEHVIGAGDFEGVVRRQEEEIEEYEGGYRRQDWPARVRRASATKQRAKQIDHRNVDDADFGTQRQQEQRDEHHGHQRDEIVCANRSSPVAGASALVPSRTRMAGLVQCAARCFSDIDRFRSVRPADLLRQT